MPNKTPSKKSGTVRKSRNQKKAAEEKAAQKKQKVVVKSNKPPKKSMKAAASRKKAELPKEDIEYSDISDNENISDEVVRGATAGITASRGKSIVLDEVVDSVASENLGARKTGTKNTNRSEMQRGDTSRPTRLEMIRKYREQLRLLEEQESDEEEIDNADALSKESPVDDNGDVAVSKDLSVLNIGKNRDRIGSRFGVEPMGITGRRGSNGSQEGLRRKTVDQSSFSNLGNKTNVKLGTFDGNSNLETFLARFENCSSYCNWSTKDQLFQLKNALTDTAGYVVNELGRDGTLQEIIDMLKCRFGSENQAEMYKAEMKARRRKSGESLQKLYQDLCRLRALAFGNEPATAFSKAYLTDIFVDALDDRDLRKLVLIQKPTSMEDALQIATHLEAIDVSTAQACRDRRDDRDTHRNRQRVNQVERSDGVKNNHTEITKQLQEVKNAVLSFQKEMQQKQFVAPASGFGKSNLNAVGPSTQVQNQNGSSWTSGENAATSSAQLLPRGTAGPRQTRVPANTCRYCGIEGHWQADCPEILKKSFKQKGASMMPQGNHNPWRTGQNFNRNNVLTSPSKMRGEIYLEIKIRAQRLGALLDTGCQHSVIGRKLIPTMKLEPTTQTLCTASGADLPLLGECVLHFRVGDYPTSVKVVVTEALTEFILGIDWLQSNECTWDFANNRFAVEGHEAKILDKLSRNAVRRL